MPNLSMIVLAATTVLFSALATTEVSAQTRREGGACTLAGSAPAAFPPLSRCNKGRRARGGHCERTALRRTMMSPIGGEGR